MPEQYALPLYQGRRYITYRNGSRIFIRRELESIIMPEHTPCVMFVDGEPRNELQNVAQKIIDENDPLLVY